MHSAGSSSRASWEMTHDGALIYGTYSKVARLPGGLTYAMLFNHLAADIAAMAADLRTQQVSAFNAVQTWPEKDLYPSADS